MVVAVGTGTVQYLLVRFWWWTARSSDGTRVIGRTVYRDLTPSWGDAVLKLAAPMLLALLPTRAAWLRFVRHRDPWVGWLCGELNGWKTAVYSVLGAGAVAWFIATRGVGTDPASQCTRSWFRQVLTYPVGDECAAVSYAPWLLGTFDLVLWVFGMLAGALLVIGLYLVFPYRRAAD